MEPNNIQNCFPVYDMLLEQVKSIPNNELSLSVSDINDLKSKIYSLDKLGKDMIYVIIRIHSIRYSDSKLLDIPYNGEKTGAKNDNSDTLFDIKFNIRNFPAKLNKMLDIFCDLHLRKLKEETGKSELLENIKSHNI